MPKARFPGVILAASAALTGAAAHAEMKIAYVDFRQVVTDSPQYKTSMTALENEFKPRARDLDNQQKELKARDDKFQRDSSVMSEAERSKAEKDLRDSQRDLVRRVNEYREDTRAREAEELQRVQKAVFQEVQNYAKAQGFDLVIGDGVLYAKDTLNITPAVLASLKAKGPAAPAAAAPGTTTPAPKPTDKKP